MKCLEILISKPLELACLAVCTWSVQAQSLATVEVVGKADSLTQASMDSAKERVKTIPGGASVVDLDAAREGRQSTWSDSLGLASGVFVQDRFGSEEARISIRGSALSRTYHSFGIQVMQDGVPINYADGFFDMQTVDPNASRYVEVLRGPNATTYGATTLGGAINFVAPTGYTSPALVGRAEAGSFGYNKVFGSAAGVMKSTTDGAPMWDYYVAGSQTQQDGFRDHAQMENQKLLGNFGVRLNRDVESRFYMAAVRSRTQLPGYLTKDELMRDPSMANSSISTLSANSTVAGVQPYRVDANRRRDVDAQRVANKTTVRDGNTLYEFAAYAMHYSLWHPIDAVIEQNAQTQGGHVKVTQLYANHELSFAYLPSAGLTQGSSRPTNNQGAASGAPTSDYAQQAKNHSFFVENKYRVSPQTTLVGALQYDSAQRKVNDTVQVSNRMNYTFTQWSPRVGLTHDLAPHHQVFTSISRNFEAPIFGLAGTTTLANQAQSGTTLEFGSRGDTQVGKHRLGWDATYYRAQLRNEFQTSCSNPPVCSSFSTQNIPNTRHEGVELGGNHVYDRQFESRVALLYSRFTFQDNAYYGNNTMPGFPPLLVRGEVLYRFGAEVNGKPAFYAGPKFEWVPRAAPMDNTHSLYNDPYALLGFKAGQAIDKKWSWFADARNLTNKKYAGTTNIAADYTATNKTTLAAYYPGDGRSLYVGLEAKFE